MCAPARALERSNIHFGSGDFESAGARGRAAYSVKCHPPPRRTAHGPLRQPGGSSRSGGARVYSEEAGRNQRQCDAHRGVTRVRAEELVSEDEDAGDWAEGIERGQEAGKLCVKRWPRGCVVWTRLCPEE